MAEPKDELTRNMIVKARRDELYKYQLAIDSKWLDSRVETGNMGRCLALIAKEAEMEKEYQECTDHAAIVNARAEKEKALGQEIAQIQREENVALLRRHYLREKDPSLRQLMQKLEAGYACRDLRKQIMDNEYRRLKEREDEIKGSQTVQNALSGMDSEVEVRKRLEAKRQYTLELQQQLVNNKIKKQCQYEDSLIEKKMLDEIMRTISDEDKRELEQKRYLTEKTKQEMETFKQAQLAWKDKQRRLVLIEEKQIEAQARQVRDREKGISDTKAKDMQLKEERMQQIVKKILSEKAEREERADIVRQLHEQEQIEKFNKEGLYEKETIERKKMETREALLAQIEHRRQLARAQKERELNYRVETEAKVRAGDDKEREKERAVREKNKRYAAELLKQAEEQRALQRARAQEERDRAKAVFDYDKDWQKEINAERATIIKEHVPPLIGYLQAGVIEKEDLSVVKEGAKSRPELANLDLDALEKTTKRKTFPKCNAKCRVLRSY